MEPWSRDAVAEVLLECGAIALRHYARPRVTLKADRSLVTDADHAIEDFLARRYDRPGEGSYLIGEETVAGRSEEYIREAMRGRAWVVDPIDGTAPYAHHLPTWAISIGCMDGGVLQEGGIYLPMMRELLVSQGRSVFYGTAGGADPQSAGSPPGNPAEPQVPPPIAWEDISGAGGPAGAAPSAAPDDVSARGQSTASGPHRQAARSAASARSAARRHAAPRYTPSGLIGITQGMAKRGRLDLPNPVQALCTAVTSLAWLCLGRYLGYVGRLKLWDLAGGLPLLLKCGLPVRMHDGPRLGPEVTPELYDLRPDSGRRWRLRGTAIFALSEDIADRLEEALAGE